MSRRSHRTDKQIRRNITGYLKPRGHENAGSIAGTAFHVFAAFFCILLPLSLVALAGSAVFRVPDLMAFEMDRSGALQELGINLSSDVVSNEIAAYLTHENENLMLTMEVANKKDTPIFSFMDEVNLDRIRGLLDKTLYPSVGAFVLSMLFFVLVRLSGRPRYLRYALRISIVFYICAICFVAVLGLYAPFREMVFAWQPGLDFAEEGVLLRLYGGLYPFLSAGAICLISFVIYIVFYSVLRRFTVEKETMFR